MIDKILSGSESGRNLTPEYDVAESIVRRLDRTVIGQRKAKLALSESLSQNVHCIIPKDGPMGVFLFLGPTGVGKTECARAVTEFLMGDKKYMVKVNGEQFPDSHSGSRLFGSPPSYVGYNDPPILSQIETNYEAAKEAGQLSYLVRRNENFGVMLIDEIEKMHPVVVQSLLGALDDGQVRLTNGKEVDLRSTLVIMTSNAGEAEKREAGKSIGFVKPQGGEREVLKKSLRFLSPEMQGRIDSIVEFDPLDEMDALQIVDLITKRVNETIGSWGEQNTKITLELSPQARSFVLEKGYSKEKGARELVRAYRKHVDNVLAGVFADHPDMFNFPNYEVRILAEIVKDRVAFSIGKKDIKRIPNVLRLPNHKK